MTLSGRRASKRDRAVFLLLLPVTLQFFARLSFVSRQLRYWGGTVVGFRDALHHLWVFELGALWHLEHNDPVNSLSRQSIFIHKHGKLVRTDPVSKFLVGGSPWSRISINAHHIICYIERSIIFYRCKPSL